MSIFQTDGQSLKQFAELGTAFVLLAAIGLEREIRHKSAGLRTYTVVGTTAALLLLVSKYVLHRLIQIHWVVEQVCRQALGNLSAKKAEFAWSGRRPGKKKNPLKPNWRAGDVYRFLPIAILRKNRETRARVRQR